MSMKLENVEIVKLLPPWMRQDEANAALSRSASSLFQEPAKRIKQLRIWDKIDELDDDMLDELAWELNIDWYSSAMEISKKRATIKVAHLIMEKRGTKWAAEQLISAYFGTGYVKEWFEYGGDPYMFRVLTTNPDIGDDGMAGFFKQVDVAKSVRSHMEGVYFYEELEPVILVSPTSTAHVFEYVKCGTRPRSANIGRIKTTTIEASPQASSHGFEYTHAGDGTKAGTYPRQANVAKIKNGEVDALPQSRHHPFEYATHAGDGTKAGTYPNRMALGEITKATVEADGSAEIIGFMYARTTGTYPRAANNAEITTAAVETDGSLDPHQFEYIRKAGTSPRHATLAETAQGNMEAAGATSVHCFTYTKCGTKKCGQK